MLVSGIFLFYYWFCRNHWFCNLVDRKELIYDCDVMVRKRKYKYYVYLDEGCLLIFLTTEGKMIRIVLSTVLCWNELGRIRLAKVWSIFWFLWIGYDVDTILLSHIWDMAVFGDCRWVEVGMEVDLLFDENWQFFSGSTIMCMMYMDGVDYLCIVYTVI